MIYSRNRHDFRWCSCKTVAIDGGSDYTRITGNSSDYEFVRLCDSDPNLTYVTIDETD